MTERRRFLGKLATLTVGTLTVAACGKQDDKASEVSQENDKNSSAPDRLLLDAFVDTIVPKDQDPGAVEAGVTDELLAWFDEKEQEKIKAGEMLVMIDYVANKNFNKPFIKLTLEQREKVLDLTASSRDAKYHPARNSMQRLRARIIRAFYLSPTGWAMLGYTAPYPGGYPDFSNPPV